LEPLPLVAFKTTPIGSFLTPKSWQGTHEKANEKHVVGSSLFYDFYDLCYRETKKDRKTQTQSTTRCPSTRKFHEDVCVRHPLGSSDGIHAGYSWVEEHRRNNRTWEPYCDPFGSSSSQYSWGVVSSSFVVSLSSSSCASASCCRKCPWGVLADVLGAVVRKDPWDVA